MLNLRFEFKYKLLFFVDGFNGCELQFLPLWVQTILRLSFVHPSFILRSFFVCHVSTKKGPFWVKEPSKIAWKKLNSFLHVGVVAGDAGCSLGRAPKNNEAALAGLVDVQDQNGFHSVNGRPGTGQIFRSLG